MKFFYENKITNQVEEINFKGTFEEFYDKIIKKIKKEDHILPNNDFFKTKEGFVFTITVPEGNDYTDYTITMTNEELNGKNKETAKNINKEELIKKLKKLNNNNNQEENHIKADQLLLKYIGDKDIEDAFNKIDKWYA